MTVHELSIDQRPQPANPPNHSLSLALVEGCVMAGRLVPMFCSLYGVHYLFVVSGHDPRNLLQVGVSIDVDLPRAPS